MAFWLHLATAKHPDRVAIVNAESAMTYSELSARAIEGRRALQARGVRGAEPVALEIEDRLQFAVALHACLLLGAPAVPIDVRLSPGERAARAQRAVTVVRDGLGLGTGGRGPAPAPDEPWCGTEPRTSPPEDAVATVMHTSGTTAAAKPVELTYGNWVASALGSAVALGLDPAERWLCAMPLAHVGGLSILIRSAIYATTVVLHERFETEAVLTALGDPDQRITMVSLVPTMLSRLLDAGLRRPPALRWALLGGGPIPTALLERAAEAGVPVAPTYGMTEACSQIATQGWPLLGAEIRTAAGEVMVRGPIVAPGSLAQDGWLHTGDLGELDERGRLVITGRQADTIVTGGENVSPGEVEAVLLAHPAVADAGVYGRPDPEWGEAVVAKVVLGEGVAIGVGDLRAFCAERLAGFKVPKAVAFVERLPRTESGKLLRRELG